MKPIVFLAVFIAIFDLQAEAENYPTGFHTPREPLSSMINFFSHLRTNTELDIIEMRENITMETTSCLFDAVKSLENLKKISKNKNSSKKPECVRALMPDLWDHNRIFNEGMNECVEDGFLTLKSGGESIETELLRIKIFYSNFDDVLYIPCVMILKDFASECDMQYEITKANEIKGNKEIIKKLIISAEKFAEQTKLETSHCLLAWASQFREFLQQFERDIKKCKK